MGRNVTDFSKLEQDKQIKEYQKFVKSVYIILGIGTIFYYVIPFAAGYYFTPNSAVFSKIIIPMLLINVNTIYSFLSCFLNSGKYGFKIIVPLAVAAYFIPATMIFYGPRMSLFAIIYFILGLFGEWAGRLFAMRKAKRKAPIGFNKHIKQSSPKKKSNK